MRTIYKYPIKMGAENVIDLHNESKILCVKIQHNTICLWVDIPDTNSFTIPTDIYIFGTGHAIPADMEMEYIDSVLMLDGDLVWHIYKGL